MIGQLPRRVNVPGRDSHLTIRRVFAQRGPWDTYGFL
jgi:hypothetical protein